MCSGPVGLAETYSTLIVWPLPIFLSYSSLLFNFSLRNLYQTDLLTRKLRKPGFATSSCSNSEYFSREVLRISAILIGGSESSLLKTMQILVLKSPLSSFFGLSTTKELSFIACSGNLKFDANSFEIIDL